MGSHVPTFWTRYLSQRRVGRAPMSVLSRYFAARASKLVAALLIARSGEGRTATLTYLQELASPPTVEELSASVYIHFGAIALMR